MAVVAMMDGIYWTSSGRSDESGVAEGADVLSDH